MTRAYLVDSRFGGMRTNMADDPRATVPTVGVGKLAWGSRWFGTGGVGTSGVVTGASDGPAGIKSYLRKTWTTAPGSGQAGDVGFVHSATYGTGVYTSGKPVTAGVTYALSSYVRSSRANAVSAGWGLRAIWHDAAGVVVGSQVAGTLVAIPAGGWIRLALVATAPAGAATVEALSSNASGNMTSIAAGDTLDGTGLLVEPDPAVRPYFDGSFRNARWTGTADASPSIGFGFVGVV